MILVRTTKTQHNSTNTTPIRKHKTTLGNLQKNFRKPTQKHKQKLKKYEKSEQTRIFQKSFEKLELKKNKKKFSRD